MSSIFHSDTLFGNSVFGSKITHSRVMYAKHTAISDENAVVIDLFERTSIDNSAKSF